MEAEESYLSRGCGCDGEAVGSKMTTPKTPTPSERDRAEAEEYAKARHPFKEGYMLKVAVDYARKHTAEIYLAGVMAERGRAAADEGDPKEKYLKIIHQWKAFWMNERDNKYDQRAFGIDANMKHDLARRLVEAAAGTEPGR
jgi:hypothetical protein